MPGIFGNLFGGGASHGSGRGHNVSKHKAVKTHVIKSHKPAAHKIRVPRTLANHSKRVNATRLQHMRFGGSGAKERITERIYRG